MGVYGAESGWPWPTLATPLDREAKESLAGTVTAKGKEEETATAPTAIGEGDFFLSVHGACCPLNPLCWECEGRKSRGKGLGRGLCRGHTTA